MTSQQIRQTITDRIVEALKSGQLPPWRRPWNADDNCGSPGIVVTKKPYSGINPLLLEVTGSRYGFHSKWWATFRQWAELGATVMRRPANVRQGQWGAQIVYCTPVRKKQVDEDGEEIE